MFCLLPALLSLFVHSPFKDGLPGPRMTAAAPEITYRQQCLEIGKRSCSQAYLKPENLPRVPSDAPSLSLANITFHPFTYNNQWRWSDSFLTDGERLSPPERQGCSVEHEKKLGLFGRKMKRWPFHRHLSVLATMHCLGNLIENFIFLWLNILHTWTRTDNNITNI